MATVAVIKCSCKHEYQDAHYGKGMRVHNVKKNEQDAICTVCLNKKSGNFSSRKNVETETKSKSKKK